MNMKVSRGCGGLSLKITVSDIQLCNWFCINKIMVCRNSLLVCIYRPILKALIKQSLHVVHYFT